MRKKYLKKRKNKRGIRKRRKKIQKGGFGGALALGMLLPQVLGTVSNILKINV